MDIFPASSDDDDDDDRSNLELCVTGYAVRIVHDEQIAKRLNDIDNLHRWNDDASKHLLIDRFDVRALVDSDSVFAKDAQMAYPDPDFDISEKNRKRLQWERYRDLEELLNQETQQNTTHTSIGKRQTINQEEMKITMRSATPELFPQELNALLPSELLKPATRHTHAVILTTARKTRANPQLEVLLRVKLASSPGFEFLSPTHELHSYYQYLKTLDATMFDRISGYTDSTTDEPHTTQPENTAQATALQFLSNYDSGTESEKEMDEQGPILTLQDELDPAHVHTAALNQSWEYTQDYPNEGDDAVELDVIAQLVTGMEGDLDYDVDKELYEAYFQQSNLKEERLKRARMLQGHFKLKLSEANTSKTIRQQQETGQGVAISGPAMSIDYDRVKKRVRAILDSDKSWISSLRLR